MTSPLIDHQALEFFNSLSATLEIELTESAQPIGGLLNLAASPEARIASLRLNFDVFDDQTETHRPLTRQELEMVVIVAPTITLQGESPKAIEHRAPAGDRMTVQFLVHAVEDTERLTRGDTNWLGGVDVHHIYFEGIHPKGDLWAIYWGS